MAEPAREALTKSDTIRLCSERFGDHVLPGDRVLDFPDGLIGFRAARRLVLLDAGRAGSPFRHLVWLDAPETGFMVCDPTVLWPGYADEVPADDVPVEHRTLFAIVTVPADAREMTANLMAPLVVDRRTRIGRQLVLDTGRYSTRHPLLPAVGLRDLPRD